MPIVRMTKKQIEEADKAREAALKKDDDFRRHEEQRQRLEELTRLAKPSSLSGWPLGRGRPLH